MGETKRERERRSTTKLRRKNCAFRRVNRKRFSSRRLEEIKREEEGCVDDYAAPVFLLRVRAPLSLSLSLSVCRSLSLSLSLSLCVCVCVCVCVFPSLTRLFFLSKTGLKPFLIRRPNPLDLSNLSEIAERPNAKNIRHRCQLERLTRLPTELAMRCNNQVRGSGGN